MVCLHATDIGYINFSVLVADCFRFPFLSCFLFFPNRSWLRSFRLAWGLGGNMAGTKRYVTFGVSPQLCINKPHKAFKIRLRLFLEDFVEFLVVNWS